MIGYIGLYDKSVGQFGDVSLMSDSSVEIDAEFLQKIYDDLTIAMRECQNRGLMRSFNWMSEIHFCLGDNFVTDEEPVSLKKQLKNEYRYYLRAIGCFTEKEFDRAAFFTENCTSPLAKFLHFYSRYLSGEKKKNIDEAVDPLMTTEQHNAPHLKELHMELSVLYAQSSNAKGFDGVDGLDGWLLWLYGVILKRLDIQKQAVEVFCQSLMLVPTQWGAWLELASLVTEKEMLENLNLPDQHWMYKLFLAHVYQQLHVNDEASAIYLEFEKRGLRNSTYIKSQMALLCHNQKDNDQAISLFKELETIDPFRLDNADMYSNVLYVKEMRVELANLAHRVTLIDKYRMETCCVVGNYYSFRGQHEKAVQYFQRALRLNPHYLAVWTLMGHEYIEMKNTNAAIQCYRQAIEVNRKDYRAWYGLGQTYEVLKLPSYSIYYYKQAHKLCPNDSRTLNALGDAYEKLEKWEEAKKCYHKAYSIGDIEDLALLRLAKLYNQLGEEERAAAVYERFLLETEDSGASEAKGQAYLFLAEHYLLKNSLDPAYEFAHKCTLHPETREAGKIMLKEIANKRQMGEQKTEESGVLAGIIHRRGGKEGFPP